MLGLTVEGVWLTVCLDTALFSAKTDLTSSSDLTKEEFMTFLK
jgi:hypothetical protein